MSKLKELDPKEKTFMANGKNYEIEESFSYDRWMQYEKLQIELSYGVTFQSLFQNLRTLWDELEQTNFAMSAVLCHNMMTGIKNKLDERIHPALRMCALFINTADEDRRTITEEQIKVKLDDWEKEGISVNSFFAIAIGFIPNFINAYKQVTQDTFLSKEPKEANPKSAS
jgi:hypothetical protein